MVEQTNQARRSRARRGTRRRGYTLVFFAMMLFGIMAMAALVIDIGFVRLTQRQMKLATDSGALVGLGLSDVEAADRNTFVGRTSATDSGRRQAVANVVAATFDDDFDNLSDAQNFGVGPDVSMTGGIPLNDGFHGSQDLDLLDPPVYKPQVELNPTNDPRGDIVIAENPATGDYTMQVRLQRNSVGAIPDIASNGGSVPYLFARASLLPSQLKATGIGLTVDSSAMLRPVVRVGVKQVVGGVSIPGAIPFAISRPVWESLPPNVSTSTLLGSGSCGSLSTELTQIGQPADIDPSPTQNDGYCPIVDAADRVIGFGWASVSPDPANSAVVRIVKHRDPSANHTVAAENATARISEAWGTLGSLSAVHRQAVMDANREFSDPLASPVLER